MPLSYFTLRDIQKRETESAAAVKLEDDFFKQVADLLAAKKNEAMGSQSIMTIREYENIRKTVISIQAKREEKIMLMALRGETEGNNLTPEERDFLRRFVDDVIAMRNTVTDLWSSEVKPEGIKKIKIIKDVEKYSGLDKNVYGPFKPGDIPTLPKEEAQWLLDAKMAEML
jgi:DNA replication initiation complex subunit (GINS family)